MRGGTAGSRLRVTRPYGWATRWCQYLFAAVLLVVSAGLAATEIQPDIVGLEGPRSLDIDINGDGIEDLVFANYTHTGNAHSYYSFSINIRDGFDRNVLHNVHIYPDGYGPGGGLRLLKGSLFPECKTRAHFLIEGNEGSYELLTAEKIMKVPTKDGFRYVSPADPGTVEFTFHRLRVAESVGPAYYIFDGYRKVKSTEEYCDAVDAAGKEVLAPENEPESRNRDDPE